MHKSSQPSLVLGCGGHPARAWQGEEMDLGLKKRSGVGVPVAQVIMLCVCGGGLYCFLCISHFFFLYFFLESNASPSPTGVTKLE